MPKNDKIAPMPAPVPKPQDRQYIRPLTKTESALHNASMLVGGLSKTAGGILDGLLMKKLKK